MGKVQLQWQVEYPDSDNPYPKKTKRAVNIARKGGKTFRLIFIIIFFLTGCGGGTEKDSDGDAIANLGDNCPAVANRDQADLDGDGLGDACDRCPTDPNNDGDGDGLCADADNCPELANPGQGDEDGDGLGDECDACPADKNNDEDKDGKCADVDNCPKLANPTQADDDADMIGNGCDPCYDDVDSDGDGQCDKVDNCVNKANPDQQDTDADGIGDVCDPGEQQTIFDGKAFYAPAIAVSPAGLVHMAYGGDKLYYAVIDGNDVEIKVADPRPGTGRYVSLALDSQGRPHMCYSSELEQRLRYAYFDGNSFLSEIVDNDSGAGQGAVLKIDSFNRPHIAYFGGKEANYAIKYAWLDEKKWTFLTTNYRGIAGWGIALILDQSDSPHLAFIDPDNKPIYAYLSGDTWQAETMPEEKRPVYDFDMVMDQYEYVHIVYNTWTDWFTSEIWDAIFDGKSWYHTVVDDDAGIAAVISMDTDSQANPRLVYSSWNPTSDLEGLGAGKLRYGRYEGEEWQVETVTDVAFSFDAPALELNAADIPQIAVLANPDSGPGRELDLFRPGDPQWQPFTIDSAFYGGFGLAGVADGLGQPHISFIAPDEKGVFTVQYGHFDGHRWEFTTLDSNPHNRLDQTTIALDSSGFTHILFSTSQCLNFDCLAISEIHLSHALFDGQKWNMAEVDAAGGLDPAMVIDPAGNIHAVYQALDSGIIYAYFDGTAWKKERIPMTGLAGYYPSIALDSQNNPHITYFDVSAYLAPPPSSEKNWRSDSERGIANEIAIPFGGLKYAWRAGSNWQTEFVSADSPAGFSQVRIGSDEIPHIAFFDPYTPRLAYCRHGNDSWQCEDISPPTELALGYGVGLVLDSADRPYISCSGTALQYAFFDGGAWISLVLDAHPVNEVDLFRADNTSLHLLYRDASFNDLKYVQVKNASVSRESVAPPGLKKSFFEPRPN